MKILFCNIAYMLHYEGQTSRDITPTGAGKWVKENADAHEKWNFLNYDGYCYGYVQNKGQFHIEHFEDVSSTASETDEVMIVWCAPIKNGKTVIVGWYEKATVYRDYINCRSTTITGIDRCYFTKALAEDCYLLPENIRTFQIERAAKAGAGKGFGQQNYWYADSEYAKKDLIPRVLEFCNEHKKDRINRTTNFFKEPTGFMGVLTEREKKERDKYLENGEYDLYLPLGYREFESEGTSDSAFYIGVALKELFQFKESIKWFNKVVDIESKISWDTAGYLVYLYQQTEEYIKSNELATQLLDYKEAKQSEARDEIYCIIADNYRFLEDYENGIKWLDRIINESSDRDLVEYTVNTKKEWSDEVY